MYCITVADGTCDSPGLYCSVWFIMYSTMLILLAAACCCGSLWEDRNSLLKTGSPMTRWSQPDECCSRSSTVMSRIRRSPFTGVGSNSVSTPSPHIHHQSCRYFAVFTPVPTYTAWWQKHNSVNNLPKVVTKQCLSGSRTCDLSIANPTLYP